MAVALIGGTGVYDPELLEDRKSETVTTPYGTITVMLGTLNGIEVAFMPRHGEAHQIPPHRINFRANIAGLKLLGVERIVSTAAVGSLNPQMQPGDFVFIDQMIDMTKAGVVTFFDGGEEGVVHTDMTEPYCPELRKMLIEVADEIDLTYHATGTYITVDGPRYETAAEIQVYRSFNADVIGMTNSPEAILSREAGLCYATAATVTNMAAGISKTPLSHDEVSAVMKANTQKVRDVCLQTLTRIESVRRCGCGG